MSTYNRTRKAERLHWMAATALVVTGAIFVVMALYFKPLLSEETGLWTACALALVPLVFLGFSGKFYRWRRVAGQSRWIALMPTGLASLWYALALLLIPTVSAVTEQSILLLHGGCLISIIGAIGLIAVLPVTKRNYADRKKERAPKTDYMDALFTELTTLADQSSRSTDIQQAIRQARGLSWESAGDREEELAGALVALKGLLNKGKTPAEDAIEDGLQVIHRAFDRLQPTKS